MKFIDYVEIDATAGHGGAGCLSFHTEKFVAKGGPDGGDGGKGGDIIVVSDTNMTTLLDYRYRAKYKADKGQPGKSAQKTGKSGQDTVLHLPVGTIVFDLDSGNIIADLDQSGARVVVVKGGRGGKGNAFFKSPTQQAPRHAQPGEPGESRKIALELKLLADVGLVGLPNAGKSTILATLSAARPKIADYPFTTLMPNLGIVKLRGHRTCVMADIPGLIKGASEGKGLGHQFLKHIQRTAQIMYVVDVNEPDINETLEILKQELADFDDDLARRASMVVITKIDTLDECDLKEVSKKYSTDYIYISAVAQKGIDQLLIEIGKRIESVDE